MGVTCSADLVEQHLRFFKAELSRWAINNTRNLPWRNTDDPYCICVAEILLHQTGASKVAPVYQDLIARYPTVGALSRAKIKTLERIIYPLGFLYRAGRLREIAKAVVSNYGGYIPSEKTGLMSLPGIGEYTASAILCFAYGKQVPIIDTNVVRLYSRFFGLSNKLPSSAPTNEIRQIASIVIPKGNARRHNYALLDFAALVCKHYNPGCLKCRMGTKCKYWITRNTKL